jgi:SAM-dependent methyltransferase
MDADHLHKAAQRGEPSYIWRSGQERRLKMIRAACGERTYGRILEDGCGIGTYLARLAVTATLAVGLEIELDRVRESHEKKLQVVNAAGENLPFPNNYFDLVLSNEVLEHVQDDRMSICEIVRTLKPGGRLVIFCPNRGYPFETHGIYWRGKYHFGNIPLVNYLPRQWRNRLAPHVNIYTRKELQGLFTGLPVKFIEQKVIFGAYDNIIARHPTFGRVLRNFLQRLENSPLSIFGLSHFWVIEKI